MKRQKLLFVLMVIAVASTIIGISLLAIGEQNMGTLFSLSALTAVGLAVSTWAMIHFWKETNLRESINLSVVNAVWSIVSVVAAATGRGRGHGLAWLVVAVVSLGALAFCLGRLWFALRKQE